MLQSEKRLAGFLESQDYKNVLRDLSSTQFKDQPNSLFQLFKNSFPTINSPFEIAPDKVAMRDYKQSISYDFVKFIPEMESSSFGRSVSNDFIFVAKLVEETNYTALLYSSVVYFGEDMQPVYTKLVTYSPTGEIISAKLFSGQFSAERIKTGHFENNKITVKEYKRIWEHPITEVPFDKNSVKKYDLQATAVFVINASGKINEESVPKNFKDSLILVNN